MLIQNLANLPDYLRDAGWGRDTTPMVCPDCGALVTRYRILFAGLTAAIHVCDMCYARRVERLAGVMS